MPQTNRDMKLNKTTIRAAIQHWPKVAPLLARPRTKADFARLTEALDAVLDAGGANEDHPLASLASHLGTLVADYEAAHHPMREMGVAKFLRELIKQHGLKQSDLPKISPQSVVSGVLSEKRKKALQKPALRKLLARARKLRGSLPKDFEFDPFEADKR